jgi:hypothetical protein
VGAAVSFFILDWVGFDSNVALQTPHTIFMIRFLLAAIPIVGLVLAIVALMRFPLTQEKMAEIRGQLEARRGKVLVGGGGGRAASLGHAPTRERLRPCARFRLRCRRREPTTSTAGACIGPVGFARCRGETTSAARFSDAFRGMRRDAQGNRALREFASILGGVFG